MPKDDAALARDRLGQVLRDRWLLEQVLGVGGMASVFGARHRNGARAAIKLLHGPVREDPVIKERFLREAYIANTVGHPGVPRVLDDDEDPTLGPYLIMELLEGESLDEIFRRQQKLPVEKMLDVADQVLDVLAAAHDRGIVHRDLKPGNVFLCRDGSVRVLDFGIARLMHEQSARLTATGMMMGTPAYMSPEQARTSGRMVDGRSDLYSVGATMFRVLAGRHVHQGKLATLIVQVATERAPKLFSLAPTVPLAVCAVVDRALEFEPERRYSSAREMQTDVRDVRSGRPPRVASNLLPTAGPVPELETMSRRGDDHAPSSLTPESLQAERAREAAKQAAAQADFHGQNVAHEMPTMARDVPQYRPSQPAGFPPPEQAVSSFAPPQPSLQQAQASQPQGEAFKSTMYQVASSAQQPVGRSTGGHLASTMYAMETTPASRRSAPGPAPAPQMPPQPMPGQPMPAPPMHSPSMPGPPPQQWTAGYPAPPPSPSYVPQQAPPQQQAPQQQWTTGGYAAAPRPSMPMPPPMPMPRAANAQAKKSSKAGCAAFSFVLVLVLVVAAVYAIRYMGYALP